MYNKSIKDFIALTKRSLRQPLILPPQGSFTDSCCFIPKHNPFIAMLNNLLYRYTCLRICGS